MTAEAEHGQPREELPHPHINGIAALLMAIGHAALSQEEVIREPTIFWV
jgi:hypothetical protein